MPLSKDQFLEYVKLSGIDDVNLGTDIWNAAQDYITNGIPMGDILDLMSVSQTAPDSYKKFVADFAKIKSTNPEITTYAEWQNARREYRTLMSQFGLEDVATNANADKFLLNGVSAREAYDRMSNAYYAVTNADEALKQQLKQYFPSLQGRDLVASLLGVGKTADELQRQITVAGIQAEAATAGLTSAIGAEELAKQGVTRQQARAGFQDVAQSLADTRAAAQRAGISTQDLQKELESESVLGLASKRRKMIQTAEQNIFQGQSGTANVSLGSSSAGQF